MLEISITIKTPDLSEAINHLAEAISGRIPTRQDTVPVENAAQQADLPFIPDPPTVLQNQAPQPAIAAQPAVVPQPAVAAQPAVAPQPAVAAQPAVAPQPAIAAQPAVVPQPVAAPHPVATQEVKATPGITLDVLSRAGADLIDQGKMQQVMGVIQKYGVLTITQIPPAQYPALAADLMALGATV